MLRVSSLDMALLHYLCILKNATLRQSVLLFISNIYRYHRYKLAKLQKTNF